VAPAPRVLLPGETDPDGPLDLALLFGRQAPVELEIGVGKARFLLAAAAAHQDRSYLGIELQHDYTRIAETKIAALGLTNVRLFSLDGKELVKRRLLPGSLAALHVYFPDPWPKKRHHKRRLVDAAFAASAARALAPGGRLYAASDHPDYGPLILETFDAEPALRRLSAEETGDWRTGTDYERKALAARKPVWRGIWTTR